MKIWKYIKPEYIFLNGCFNNKDEILQFIAKVCEQKNMVKDASTIYKGLKQREETMSTGAGSGIAFPHTMSWEVYDPSVFIVQLAEPVDFDSIDNKPVDMIISLIVPAEKIELHLQLLAGVSRLCKKENFLESVRQAQDNKKLWTDIKVIEDKMAFH